MTQKSMLLDLAIHAAQDEFSSYLHKLPAPERALLTITLAPDKKLIRDRVGHWNYRKARRELPGSYVTVRAQRKGNSPFVSGFKDRTIRRLTELGRLRTTKYNEEGVPIEVAYVPI